MGKALEIGGAIAAIVLVVFGIVSIVLGIDGRDTVTSTLERESIVGTPDMTPEGIEAAAQEAGLKNVDLPDCDVAEKQIDSGDRARCFASYMRVHALEATGATPTRKWAATKRNRIRPRRNLPPGAAPKTKNSPSLTRKPGNPPKTELATSGYRDRPRNGSQHELHGRPAVVVRDRDRGRAAAHRHRLRGARRERRGRAP